MKRTTERRMVAIAGLILAGVALGLGSIMTGAANRIDTFKVSRARGLTDFGHPVVAMELPQTPEDVRLVIGESAGDAELVREVQRADSWFIAAYTALLLALIRLAALEEIAREPKGELARAFEERLERHVERVRSQAPAHSSDALAPKAAELPGEVRLEIAADLLLADRREDAIRLARSRLDCFPPVISRVAGAVVEAPGSGDRPRRRFRLADTLRALLGAAQRDSAGLDRGPARGLSRRRAAACLAGRRERVLDAQFLQEQARALLPRRHTGRRAGAAPRAGGRSSGECDPARIGAPLNSGGVIHADD